MANPQKENGFTPIAHEILDKLVNTPLLGTEFQILFCILRKTYGYQKKSDWISFTQFEIATGLSRPTISKGLKNLILRKIIISNKYNYTFNKDYELWIVNTPLLVKHTNKIGKHAFTKTSKHAFTHNRKYKTKENNDFSILEDIIKTTMPYINYDTGDIHEDTVKKQRLTGTENKELIAIGCLWVNMVKNETGLEDQEIPVRGLINYIRNIYLKEKWDYKDFKEFFEYYMEKTKPEDKPNFGFCMNSQFVTKYKLANKNRRLTNVSMADEIII